MANVIKKKYKTCTRWKVYYRKEGYKNSFCKTFTSPKSAMKFASEVDNPIDPNKMRGWGYG